MAVWSDDDDITCVHPGGPRVVGPAAIRAAFESMFSNGTIDAHPEKVRRLDSESTSVHSVLERVRVLAGVGDGVRGCCGRDDAAAAQVTAGSVIGYVFGFGH